MIVSLAQGVKVVYGVLAKRKGFISFTQEKLLNKN
jgi:hypothetical protein